jgi:anthranilate synthase/indole-3-glycerol phosphate synthase/phosphoribosylanthranilate isomerase
MGLVKDVLTQDQKLQVLLAGGLNPENVADAVRATGELCDRIIGVDVSSGVEENGVQSVSKIQAFIKAARSVR